jgi:hypothetical protein
LFTHIVSPFKTPSESIQSAIQRTTIRSIDEARRYAKQQRGYEIQVLGVSYPEDKEAAAFLEGKNFLEPLLLLNRSVMDFVALDSKQDERRLPLVQHIFEAAATRSKGRYVVFTSKSS